MTGNACGFSAAKTQPGDDTIKLTLYSAANITTPLTRRQVIDLWQTDEAFRAVFSRELASVPMEAFFWETPAWSQATLDQPFECMLTAAPALARQTANPRPFAAHIGNSESAPVVCFGNIGGDADLVVPCDRGGGADHAHLAAFLRSADAAQCTALWRRVGETAALWLAKGKPFWISTSGLGVAWLHVRIEARPKYYTHRPYRHDA